VIAYKFLARGAVSPFSALAWPAPSGATPGAWHAASAGSEAWIHGCRPADLPYWVDAELWRVELSEPVRPVRHEVQADRGRLLGRIEGWDPEAKRDFTVQCALRTRDFAAEMLRQEGRDAEARALASCGILDELAAAAGELQAQALPERSLQLLGYCGDAAFFGRITHAGCVSYIAAIAAADLRRDPAALEAERAWQARWLCARLELPPAT